MSLPGADPRAESHREAAHLVDRPGAGRSGPAYPQRRVGQRPVHRPLTPPPSHSRPPTPTLGLTPTPHQDPGRIRVTARIMAQDPCIFPDRAGILVRGRAGIFM